MPYAGAERSAEIWAEFNDCDMLAYVSLAEEIGPPVMIFENCENDVPVVLAPYLGEHNLPPDSASLVWSFLSQHALDG